MNNRPGHSFSSTEPSGAGPLGQFEERLLGDLKTVVASRAVQERPEPDRARLVRSPRPRGRAAAVTALGLSAAVAAGVVAAAVSHPAASPAPRYTLAADFLNRAAAAARAQNAPLPKAGQVFYFKQLQVFHLKYFPPGRECLVMWQPSPLTGRASVIFGKSGCPSGVPSLPAGYRQFFSSPSGPWYPALNSLPTAPAALRAALSAAAARGGDYWGLPRYSSTEQIAFLLASRLLEGPVSGSLRAALYEVISQVPGVSLLQNVTDAAGRHGTGILLPIRSPRYGTLTITFIITPGTYRFLGWTQEAPGNVAHTADLGSGLVALPRP